MFALLKTTVNFDGDETTEIHAVSESVDKLMDRAVVLLAVEDDEATLEWNPADGDSLYRHSKPVRIALDDIFFEIDQVEVLS